MVRGKAYNADSEMFIHIRHLKYINVPQKPNVSYLILTFEHAFNDIWIIKTT